MWYLAKEYTPPLNYNVIVWDGNAHWMGHFENTENGLIFQILTGDSFVEANFLHWTLLPKPPKQKDNTEG